MERSNNNRLDDTTMPGMLDTAVSSVSLHHRGIIEQEIAEKAKRRSLGYIKTILSPSSSVGLILLFSKFHGHYLYNKIIQLIIFVDSRSSEEKN